MKFPFWRRKQRNQELDAELQSHLQMARRERIERGESPDEAGYSARREFGNVALVKDTTRDMWPSRWLDEFLHDVRYGLRQLRRNPGLALVAVLTLALGISVNTAAFTVFNTQLRPFPVEDPDSMVRLRAPGPGFSYPQYQYLRDRAQAFTDLTARAEEKVLVAEVGSPTEAEEVTGAFVSHNFFHALGGRTALGRTFTADEDSVPARDHVVVLSHYYWNRRFGADRDIIGRTILLDGKPFQVIGVMDRRFVGVRVEMPALWLPLMSRVGMPSVYERDFTAQDSFANPDFGWLQLQGRLKPGTTRGGARTEVVGLLAQVTPRTAEPGNQVRFQVEPLSGLQVTDLWLAMALVMPATGIVLLISCSNIANLLLARAASRQKEIGLRLCLGAGRGRIVRQLLTESFLLALLAGGAGLLLAWWLADLMKTLLLPYYGGPAPDSVALNLTPDLRILGFTLLLAVLSCVVFGLAPALRSTRTDPVASLKEEASIFGRRMARSRFFAGLVVAQTALCLILLIPAGLMLRGLAQAFTLDYGFDTQKLLYVGYSLELSGYDRARALQFYRELEERLKGMPDVQSISLGVPPLSRPWRGTIVVPGENGTDERRFERSSFTYVSQGYLHTIGIPIILGRGFTADEMRPVPGAVIISESAARTLWPGQNPLGKTFRMERGRTVVSPSLQVVGVARDAQMSAPGEVLSVFLYLPYAETQWTDVGALVRTSGSAAEVKSTVRALLRTMEPTTRLFVRTMEESIASSEVVVKARAVRDLALVLGLLALTLAAVGLYGVMSYAVTLRTREIGIRMALGASRGRVLRLVLTHGTRLVIAGTMLGVIGGVAISRVLSSILFGLRANDVTAYAGVSLFLGVVALVAMYLPASRAARVDPMAALRHE